MGVISLSNRAFLYGDGFFETMIVNDKGIFLWDFHVLRMDAAFEILKMRLEQGEDKLRKEIAERIGTGYAGARVKLHICREEGGTYLPQSNKASVTIVVSEHGSIFPDMPAKTFGIYPESLKGFNKLSSIKTLNCLPYTMASIWANEAGYDDAVILNQEMRVAEFTSSNIFMLKNGKWYTPAVEEGCVAGVMRNFILSKTGIEITEGKITVNDLSNADFIFSANAAGLIVKALPGKKYSDEAFDLYKKLYEKAKALYFETITLY